ncbi:hypothetical protein C4D60_Mb07t23390 [Musa balbisiana]|uniref:Uncharacterized protein n=1 Tax=Musa balbisiana TaxID=52838 RepID=A0A4S8JHF9_MUSBA|nr:hypothetical protein C4D60_Mb07t23390 [Musa balbisiana]
MKELTLDGRPPPGAASSKDLGIFAAFSGELDPSSPSRLVQLVDALLQPSRADSGLGRRRLLLFPAVASRIREALTVHDRLIRLPQSGNSTAGSGGGNEDDGLSSSFSESAVFVSEGSKEGSDPAAAVVQSGSRRCCHGISRIRGSRKLRSTSATRA